MSERRMSEPGTIASTSYTPGTWFGIIGESATVLLPPSEKSRAGALWALVDDGAGFDEVLDALVATGLSSLPGFVLIAGDVTPEGGSVRTVVRGPSVVSFEAVEGAVEVDGSTSKTWVERTLEGVTRMSVSLGEEGATGEPMTALGGLLRVSGLEVPPLAPESNQDDSPESRAGFVGSRVAVEEGNEESVDAPAQAVADPLSDPLPEDSYDEPAAFGAVDAAAEETPEDDAPNAAPSLSVVPPIPVSGDAPDLGSDADAGVAPDSDAAFAAEPDDEPISVSRGEESGDALAPRHDDQTEHTESFETQSASQEAEGEDYREPGSHAYEDDYASDEHAAAVASSFGPPAVSPEPGSDPEIDPEAGADAETEVLPALDENGYPEGEQSYDEQGVESPGHEQPEAAQAPEFGPPPVPPPPPLTPPPPPIDGPPAFADTDSDADVAPEVVPEDDAGGPSMGGGGGVSGGGGGTGGGPNSGAWAASGCSWSGLSTACSS